MEFGLFLQGYVPGPAAHDTDREHEAFLREVELVVLADRTNWKYAWFSEHHALTEYSHLSSSEVMMAYLARATEELQQVQAQLDELEADYDSIIAAAVLI